MFLRFSLRYNTAAWSRPFQRELHGLSQQYQPRSIAAAIKSSTSRSYATNTSPATGQRSTLALYVLLGLAVPTAYYYGRSTSPSSNFLAATSSTTSAQLATEAVNDRSTAPLSETPMPYHDISLGNLKDAKDEIEKILGSDGIDDSMGARHAHAFSEWSSASPDSIAAFICYPTSTEDVSKVVKICHRRRIPITAFSGGTSLEGALASTRGGICIDFQKMNKIIALHKDDLDVVVQPAVGWESLNQELASNGLFFPPDPGPGAQIGGMIGTGCSGTNAYRYGTMRDWVISLTIVMADGTIVRTRNRPRKSSAGYDLTRLLVGSSGTLGLVTEATLKLTDAPRNVRVAVIPFASNDSAVRLVVKVIQSGLQLAAIELLDDYFMKVINDQESTSKTWKETPTLFVKFSGPPAAVKEQMEMVQQFAKEEGIKKGPGGMLLASDPDEVDELWSARKTAMWALMASKRDPDEKFLSADPGVPISRLAKAIDQSKKLIDEAGLYGSTLGHVGDGNYHVGYFYAQKDEAKARKVMADIEKKIIELEGTITGEHGIGLDRRAGLRLELGEEAVDMMRKIKIALDPHCLLNCDKIIEMPEAAKKTS